MNPLPTTHALIPASVRYDLALPPAARLLYGEITALCAQRGYCWATNNYFARLYQVRRATVSAWISQLIERGHLATATDPARSNQRLLRPAAGLAPTPSDKSVAPSDLSDTAARFSAPPIPPNRTTYPEISFTEMEALLLGKKNDNNEWERGGPLAPELEVEDELNPAGAVPPPIPPVARPPLPAPPAIPPGGATASTTAPKFVRPTLAQVTAFFVEQPDTPVADAPAEATRFFNYYQANGWRVGRHAMADWPAAARNWLLNADRFKASTPGPAAGAATRLHSGGTKNYHEPL
ncbi:helix-turn-helix domain-containing protein [Hymenobacter sp. IS2118]|uniref:helix-turn-helix domain-containing protein n=1 Tax=Hymenobacter sp. IS2118 TaxID=1505605 RepID=UPI000691237A|nr:helix-turn-helix domain-containing protein [Hymenobacter sp. IS2118]